MLNGIVKLTLLFIHIFTFFVLIVFGYQDKIPCSFFDTGSGPKHKTVYIIYLLVYLIVHVKQNKEYKREFHFNIT